MSHRRLLLVVCTVGAVAVGALAQTSATQPTSDWPVWGGNTARSAQCVAGSIPHEWDVHGGQNIKWKVRLGSYSYGGPIIADGRIYVGTNNAAELRPGIAGDKGCLLCLSQVNGKLLWQATHDKLPSGPPNDWPEQGVASSPAVDGERVYYVSNRCELVCADARGFHDDENDGPLRAEKLRDKLDADFVWILDMMGELDVYPHNLAACAPVVVGDLVFVCTSNGVNDEHDTPPKPDAPSFIAVNKHTGKVVWKRNDPGRDILHGQWSSPAVAVIDGVTQAIFGGGDGVCYSFAAETGKLLWRFDLNPKDAVWEEAGTGTKTAIVATPVIAGNTVYLAVGDDPEHALAPGHFYAIDATKRGDITQSGRLWHVGEEFSRTIASVAVADGLVYATDLDGYLSCFDAKTGKRHWRYDMEASVWGSPAVIDGKVMLGNTDGELIVLKHGKELEELARNDMRQPIYTTPVGVGDTLYIVTQRTLYAIAAGNAQSAGTPLPNREGLGEGGACELLMVYPPVVPPERGDGAGARSGVGGEYVDDSGLLDGTG